MELRQLKTFRTVGQLLSFHRAAEVLNYAQSTISAQIKALEQDFGVPLFDRLGKRVILTEAGQMLMRYAQKMIDVEQETMTQISGWQEPHGSISIRIPQSIGTYHLPSVLSRFQSIYPKVGFDISSCAFHSLQQELRTGITDLAFLLTDSINVSDLKSELLRIEPLVIVSHPDHRLASLSSVGIQDLEGESILLPKHDCSYKMLFEQILTEEKVGSTTFMEFNSIEAIKQCVLKGVGVTMIPMMSVEKEIAQKKLKMLPWAEEKLETAVLMIWHKDKWISPTLRAFMDTVKEVMKCG